MNADGTGQTNFSSNAAADHLSSWQPLIPPTANDDSGITTVAGQPVTIDVLANDSDIYGPLDPASVTVTVQPANGTTSVNAVTGAITYTPNAGFVGTNSFTYRVCSTVSATLCDTAAVSITVTAAATTPTAPNTGSGQTPIAPSLLLLIIGTGIAGLAWRGRIKRSRPGDKFMLL